MKRTAVLSVCILIGAAAAQEKAPLPPLPAPQFMPRPAADTGRPYTPQAILPGGIVVPLFSPDSPYLKADKLHVPEVYNMSRAVPGRISSIISIHNPSIEIHLVEKGINTGTAIIVIAGGGHRTLNVGGEAADFVPFFANYGISTVILRNRLRSDGYVAEVDAARDAQQAVRVVRAYAKGWDIDPHRVGVMGFSAGAELAARAAVFYGDWDDKNRHPADPFAGISSRPDFVGLVYPGPTPFARNRTAPPIPRDAPPAFLVCGGAGDRVHAVWALEYEQAMLMAGVPNVELHLYGNGRHPGDTLPDGGRMSGGLTDRNGIPFGTWQYRFIDWARDLGFLQKPGVETKAAKDVAAYVADLPRPLRPGREGAGRGSPRPAGPGAALAEPRFKPIFNGKDLTGWRLNGTDLAGKTATDDGRFAVKDAVLVITGSKDTPPRMAEIDTVDLYDGDFTLRLEFRASRGANSGLHLRDKAFAHQLQIRDYPRVGPFKALKGFKDEGWNAIEVVVTGTRARCTCNGEQLEAALGIPEKGPLALQSETGVVEYRNIRIKPEPRAEQVK
jgi:acetyl esterase/lipase